MEETLRNIKLAVTGLAGAVTAVFGWMGWLVLLWVCCMGADYVTGTLAAARAGQWSSQKARDGLWHKAGMFFVVLAALVLDGLIRIILGNIPAVTLPFDYSFLLAPLVLVCGHRAGQHGRERRGHGRSLPGLFAEGPGSGTGRAGISRGEGHSGDRGRMRKAPWMAEVELPPGGLLLYPIFNLTKFAYHYIVMAMETCVVVAPVFGQFIAFFFA